MASIILFVLLDSCGERKEHVLKPRIKSTYKTEEFQFVNELSRMQVAFYQFQTSNKIVQHTNLRRSKYAQY